MYEAIQIPFGCVMLFNVVNLKPGIKPEDVELALGEMCNVVKNTYGDDKGGFIGGQVFKYSGFVSKEGSLGGAAPESTGEAAKQGELVIITYWKSFEQHEKSHADKTFKEKFSELGAFCDDTYEMGYEMMWQGVPE